VLPLLYLHGLSTGDFVPALGQFLGSSAGLSAPVISKLTETWKAEQRTFSARDLSSVDYVYLWVDGIHVNIRLEEHKLCLLVMIGVRADGRKELVALTDGYRESTESWADLLRDCARRGMRAPVLAIGDGALGFWGALREVFPQARTQRCWFHKIANVLGALPKSAHPGAKKALAEIWNAEDRRHALDAVRAFETAYGAKFPKAVAKITDDVEELLAFYDYPAEHWIHLRTTDEIVNPLLDRAGLWSWVPFFLRSPGSLRSPVRSRGQGGAPAAQRGRTTLTVARTGVAFGGGGRGPTPSRSAGCGAVSPAAPRCPERASKVAPQWWRPRPPPTCRHRPCGSRPCG